MNTFMKTVIAVGMAAGLCGCASVKAGITTTTTTTTTDKDGNTETTTTTTTTGIYPEGSCGSAALDSQEHKVNVTIINDTGEDMNGLYCCLTGATEWSNLLQDGEVLADGESLDEYLTLTYSADSMSFDLGLKGPDQQLIEFDAIDISALSAEGFTITFTADGWTAK